MSKVEDYLRDAVNKDSRLYYRTGINHFFRCINKDETTYFDNPNIKDIEEDLLKYADYLEIKFPNASHTRNNYFTPVKRMLWYCDLDKRISNKTYTIIKNKIGKRNRIVEDTIPTKEELKKILNQGSIKHQAFFLTLISSGMRVGEALEIPIQDFHLEEQPPRIFIQGKYTKTNQQRHTFISQEAKEKIDSWLKIRKKYLATKKNRLVLDNMKKTSNKEDKMFPFSYHTSRVMWNRMLWNSGVENKPSNKRERVKRHIHTLRMFFRSYLSPSVSRDIVEALMGHQSYLETIYGRYTNEKLGNLYLQGETEVTIFGSSQYNGERLEQLEKDRDMLIEELRTYRERSELEMRELSLNTQIIKEERRLGNKKTSKKLKELKDELDEIQDEKKKYD